MSKLSSVQVASKKKNIPLVCSFRDIRVVDGGSVRLPLIPCKCTINGHTKNYVAITETSKQINRKGHTGVSTIHCSFAGKQIGSAFAILVLLRKLIHWPKIRSQCRKKPNEIKKKNGVGSLIGIYLGGNSIWRNDIKLTDLYVIFSPGTDII